MKWLKRMFGSEPVEKGCDEDLWRSKCGECQDSDNNHIDCEQCPYDNF